VRRAPGERQIIDIWQKPSIQGGNIMRDCNRAVTGVAMAVIVVFLALPAAAQVEDQLSSYTGVNAEGYLTPLNDAFAATLNSGFFRSAYLPTSGFNIGFEVLVMGLYFSDDARWFDATTEGAFLPQQTVPAPTIVGQGKSVSVAGINSTNYVFPGGLNLNSFAMLAPQLRISSLRGTEFVGRYARVNSGDAELGDVTLWGLGIRHNVSQYMGVDFPVDIAIGGIYQKFTAGENTAGGDLMDSDALSIGGHASKRFPAGFAMIEPYTALSYDSFKTTVEYDSDVSGPTTIDFDTISTAHWTIGLNLNLVYTNIFAEYSVASTNSFGVGIAVGALGY
jgi:hypothetical protein